MKLFKTGLVLFTLAACDSPHPAFNAMQRQTITVQGSTFQVRIRSDIAEAIRTNFEFNPKSRAVFPKATKAIEIASGCKVVPGSMEGDPALVRARIDCA